MSGHGKLRQRLWDLVRHQRMELHAAGLITDEEYARLSADHQSVGRMQSYDEMRAEIVRLRTPPPAPAQAGSFVDVVFDGPPSHESGRFVECEDANRASVSVGEWIDRKDGHWALRIPLAAKVRVKLPEPMSLEFPVDIAAAHNRAVRACAAALRAAGVLIEGEQ